MFTHRWRKNIYPVKDELVMVKVTNTDEYGASCILLEYGNIEARMSVNEYSNKRRKSYKNIVKPNTTMVLEVIAVDPEKGYIDLSKKHISGEDEVKTKEIYKRNKFVDGIITSLCIKNTHLEVPNLYQELVWPLTQNYTDSYTAFQNLKDNNNLLSTFNLETNVEKDLIAILEHKYKKPVVKVGTEVNVTCFGPDGVTAIKAAMKEALYMSNEEFPLIVSIVACPTYAISTKTTKDKKAIAFLELVLAAIENKIKSYQYGDFTVKVKPQIL